jgi:ferredoxin-thioredoxin reductase catalytic subunit
MTDLKSIAITGLKRNKELYGKAYCPCLNPSLFSQDNAEDYVCPCKVYRETDECHCGLYV